MAMAPGGGPARTTAAAAACAQTAIATAIFFSASPGLFVAASYILDMRMINAHSRRYRASAVEFSASSLHLHYFAEEPRRKGTGQC